MQSNELREKNENLQVIQCQPTIFWYRHKAKDVVVPLSTSLVVIKVENRQKTSFYRSCQSRHEVMDWLFTFESNLEASSNKMSRSASENFSIVLDWKKATRLSEEEGRNRRNAYSTDRNFNSSNFSNSIRKVQESKIVIYRDLKCPSVHLMVCMGVLREHDLKRQ
jgi:hypothetical protein